MPWSSPAAAPRIPAAGRPRPGGGAALRRDAQTDRLGLPRPTDSRRRRRALRAAGDRLSAVKPELQRAGAAWVEVNATFSNAVVDRNLVTAAAWPGHPHWMREFLAVLGSRIEAERGRDLGTRDWGLGIRGGRAEGRVFKSPNP